MNEFEKQSELYQLLIQMRVSLLRERRKERLIPEYSKWYGMDLSLIESIPLNLTDEEAKFLYDHMLTEIGCVREIQNSWQQLLLIKEKLDHLSNSDWVNRLTLNNKAVQEKEKLCRSTKSYGISDFINACFTDPEVRLMEIAKKKPVTLVYGRKNTKSVRR